MRPGQTDRLFRAVRVAARGESLVTKSQEEIDFRNNVELKDPALAAFLAWLVPGLGHLYQGRKAKAALFCVCILGTFIYGLYLGSSESLGAGRVVYFRWHKEEKRLPYLCQVGAGVVALPALVQARRVKNGLAPRWNGFMAPPALHGQPTTDDPSGHFDEHGQPTLDHTHHELHHYFELGTVFTMIAGLLNVLVVYDAWGGPVFGETAKKEDEEQQAAKSDPPDEAPSGGTPTDNTPSQVAS
jgi:hypothetical protein